MKYDDASWHYGGDFPAELPPEAGATHSGMFLAWALLNGLGGSIYVTDCPQQLEGLEKRLITPGQFFITECDEKFTDEDLSDEGNSFAAEYFDFDRGSYLADYKDALASGLPSLYHVADSWENFDLLRPVLDARYAQWKEGRLDAKLPSGLLPGKKWWKF